VSRRQPQSLDEFGCWLNAWGDEDKHKADSDAYRRGYHDAMYAAFLHFDRITETSWMSAWRVWTRQWHMTPVNK